MKQNKKIIALYLRQLRAALICPNSIKKAFLIEIRRQIAELESQNPVLSMEDLHREIGSPDEIARSFENREDLDRLKAKAKKYTLIKIICGVCLAIALIAVAVTVIVVQSNDDYYAKTESKISEENKQ